MNKIKEIIKNIIPGVILNQITGLFYGWHGDYSSWEKAQQKCTGYNADIILTKVKESSLKVKEGMVAYERDSVLFEEVQYAFPVLSGLMWVAAQNKGKLHVLDYGGALGSSYYQNKYFLNSLEDVKWCIVEQPNFVKTGLAYFSDGKLQFYDSIDDCLTSYSIDVILLSGVLQYIQEPYKLLESIKTKNFNYIIFDRTPFVKGNDRLTIQKVHPAIYKATYPCWFFNKTKFLNYMKQDYEIILEFEALDKANISSEFKGFLFKAIAV